MVALAPRPEEKLLEALIAQETGALRDTFPRLSACRARIDAMNSGAPKFSACLDLRLPQSQLLVSGQTAGDPATAIRAAFNEARERLAERVCRKYQ